MGFPTASYLDVPFVSIPYFHLILVPYLGLPFVLFAVPGRRLSPE
jgi:hypothetical protein